MARNCVVSFHWSSSVLEGSDVVEVEVGVEVEAGKNVGGWRGRIRICFNVFMLLQINSNIICTVVSEFKLSFLRTVCKTEELFYNFCNFVISLTIPTS